MARNIANRMTVFRLLASPIVVFLFWLAVPPHPADLIGSINPWLLFAANWILFFADVTDMLDGWVARKYGEVSDFGKLVDPLADKIIHLGGYICLMYAGLAGLWVVIILLYRELVVGTLRVMAGKHGVVVQARISGKLKTLAQATALNWLFLFIFIKYFWHPFPLRTVAEILNIIVVTITLYSGWDYYRAITRLIRRSGWGEDLS